MVTSHGVGAADALEQSKSSSRGTISSSRIHRTSVQGCHTGCVAWARVGADLRARACAWWVCSRGGVRLCPTRGRRCATPPCVRAGRMWRMWRAMGASHLPATLLVALGHGCAVLLHGLVSAQARRQAAAPRAPARRSCFRREHEKAVRTTLIGATYLRYHTIIAVVDDPVAVGALFDTEAIAAGHLLPVRALIRPIGQPVEMFHASSSVSGCSQEQREHRKAVPWCAPNATRRVTPRPLRAPRAQPTPRPARAPSRHGY